MKQNEQLYMVFDVESIGLHGEGFAVGYVVVNSTGAEIDQGLYACPPHVAQGEQAGRDWVKANIPSIEPTFDWPSKVREAFWSKWIFWKNLGALLAADCAWPVESNFLEACVSQKPAEREWEGPYPLIDISSVIFAKGGNPLATHTRLPTELPLHQPLADARQSARLLIETLYYGEKET